MQIAVGLVPMDPKYLVNGNVAPLLNGHPNPNPAATTITVVDALVILEKVVGLVSW